MLAAGMLWQTRFGTVPDTSWIITMCEAVLSGKRLYVDIVETNPPFSLWLYMPAVWLAAKLGVAPEAVVQAYAYAIALGGLLFAGLVASKAGLPDNSRLIAWFPALLAVLVLLPGSAFTEREHLGTALFLPLVVLMAWRAMPEEPRPGLLLAGGVGLSASALLLVKPYYAVAVLVPALWTAWRRRNLLLLFAPEFWVIGAVCLGYLAAVMRFHPEFLRDIYPLLADTYMQIRSVVPALVLYGVPFSILAGFFAWLARKGSSPLATVALLAAVAALFPLFYQGKGWAYHAYPALALLSVALVCLLAASPWRPLPFAAGRRGLRDLVAVTILFTGFCVAWIPFTFSQKPDARLVSAIREATVAPSVALVGSSIANGFPLTRMVNGRWTSRYVGDWLGSFALGLARERAAAGNEAEAQRYRRLAEDYVAQKRREFASQRPDILLLDRNDEFWIMRALGTYGFAAQLEEYRLLAEEGGLAVFLRKDYRRPGA